VQAKPKSVRRDTLSQGLTALLFQAWFRAARHCWQWHSGVPQERHGKETFAGL